MKIAINAQLIPGQGGGIEPFVKGLVYGLGQLTDGDEEYVIVTDGRAPDWLNDQLGPNQTVVSTAMHNSGNATSVLEPLKKLLLPVLKLIRGNKPRQLARRSDGFWENMGADVIHFTYQQMVLSDIPTIFNPHDLQHLHLPDFFTEEEREYRRAYKEWCVHAKYVVSESDFVKQDIVQHYQIDAEKIYTIRRGIPTQLYGEPSADDLAQLKAKLPFEQFIFYPAQTWPHKNHMNLLRALLKLRDEGTVINLVCSGGLKPHYKEIEKFVQENNLSGQVHFAGYVTEQELMGLYHLCEMVVFPSLFEGGGFPVLEAFTLQKALCCANIPPLLEIGANAAVFFNPNDPADMAQAIVKLYRNNALQAQLTEHGAQRVQKLSWTNTARAYRALYRMAAGKTLSEQDRRFLVQAAQV